VSVRLPRPNPSAFRRFSAACLGVAAAGLGLLTTGLQAQAGRDWAAYLGDEQRSHYSTLDQINAQNVAGLEVAWTYSSGDYKPARGRRSNATR
jgi:glucose dehydrogenase